MTYEQFKQSNFYKRQVEIYQDASDSIGEDFNEEQTTKFLKQVFDKFTLEDNQFWSYII
mgnify:CR=1 FL=1